MGEIIDQTFTKVDIPINCVRKLHEKVPYGLKFVKLPFEEGDTTVKYKLQVSFIYYI